MTYRYEPHEREAAGLDDAWNERKRDWIVIGIVGVCAGVVAAFAILMKVILL